jgi:translation initiation factor IF-2
VQTADESQSDVPSKAQLNVILKTDVLGSKEAIVNSLAQFSKDGVGVKVVRTGLGTITEHDVLQAEASHAALFGFNVPLQPQAEVLAKAKGITVGTYRVIYDLLDQVKKQLGTLLKPELVRSQLGTAQVIQIFRRGKRDMIVGCRVQQGVVRGGTVVHVLRGTTALTDAKLTEVRLGKEVVGEVSEGGECGVKLQGEPIIEIGDMLEVYHEEIRNRVIT